MTSNIVINYYISKEENPINQGNEAWQSFLPLNRYLDSSKDSAAGISVTCGEYFSAIKSFLSSDSYQVLIRSISAGYEKTITHDDIDKIHVILIKHGEFYHPAKIRVDSIAGDSYKFVLNVAVSENGVAIIAQEYSNFSALDMLFPYSYLPKMYHLGGINIREDRELPMFLAEWCQGYNEFHWSMQPGSEDLGIVVWDEQKGNYFLDQDQTIALFSQAAMILTCYYNFSSCYHISMWHHGAGDFVVCTEDKNVSVKLITVREYIPLIEDNDPDMWALMETLFVFFINLSIRIRLDRLDGVKETVWANELAVVGTVEGFFIGLQHQVVAELIPEELFDGVKMYFKTFSQENILDWSTNIVSRVYQKSPDLNLIKSHLNGHAHQLHGYLANI